jgi:hypothetical protein
MTKRGYRKHQRKSVNWASHARSDGLFMISEAVRDISSHGLFLEISRSALPAVGAPIRLTLFPHGLGQGIVTQGRVTWVGTNADCRGVGVSLSEPLPNVA